MEPNIVNEIGKQVVQNQNEITNTPSILATGDDNTKNIVKDENAPLYYSKAAINTFSILLSALFGAILMAINLRKINKKVAWLVVLLGIIYLVAITIILNKMNLGSMGGFVLNGIGAYFLNEYFWNKYIGKDTKYRARKTWLITIIAILIIVGIVALAILGKNQEVKNTEMVKNGQQGIDYIKEGKYKEAIDSFTININNDDKDAQSYTLRGFAKFKSQDFSGAKSDLEYALTLKNNSFNYRSTYYYLGMVQNLAQNEPKLAIENFTTALSLSKDSNNGSGFSDEEIYYQRALANFTLKNYTEALEDINKVIKVDPEFKNIFTKNALTIRALIEAQTGDTKSACIDATNSKDATDGESDLGKVKGEIIKQTCK